jgi:hypothetical protein
VMTVVGIVWFVFTQRRKEPPKSEAQEQAVPGGAAEPSGVTEPSGATERSGATES